MKCKKFIVILSIICACFCIYTISYAKVVVRTGVGSTTSSSKSTSTQTKSTGSHYCKDSIGGWEYYTDSLHCKKCTVCKQVQKTESHTFSGNTCMVCFYTKSSSTPTPTKTPTPTPTPTKTLTPTPTITKTNNHMCNGNIGGWEYYTDKLHCRKCTVCKQIYKTGEHTYSGNICTVCKHVRPSGSIPTPTKTPSLTIRKTTGSCNHYKIRWKISNTTHTKICALCGIVLDVGEHSFTELVSDATQHGYKCKDCAKVVAKENHIPKYGPYTGWEADSTHHYLNCAKCGETIKSGKHTPGVKDPSRCGPCGIELKTSKPSVTPTPIRECKKTADGKHIPKLGTNAGWEADDKRHWVICSACGETIKNEAHTRGKNDKSKCGPCGYPLGETSTKRHTHSYDIPISLTDAEKSKYGLPKDSYRYYWMTCSCGARRAKYTSVIKNYTEYADNNKDGYINKDIENILRKEAEKAGLPYEYVLGTFLRENTKDGTTWFGETWIKSCVSEYNKGKTTNLERFFDTYFGESKSFSVNINGVETIITKEELAKHPEYLSNVNVAIKIGVAQLKNGKTNSQTTEQDLKKITEDYAGTYARNHWSAEHNKVAADWTEAYYKYAMIIGTLETTNTNFSDPGIGAFYCYLQNKAIGENYDSFKVVYTDGKDAYVPNNNEIHYTESGYQACKKVEETYKSLINKK